MHRCFRRGDKKRLIYEQQDSSRRWDGSNRLGDSYATLTRRVRENRKAFLCFHRVVSRGSLFNLRDKATAQNSLTRLTGVTSHR